MERGSQLTKIQCNFSSDPWDKVQWGYFLWKFSFKKSLHFPLPMHLQNTLIFISNNNLTRRAFANANSTLFDTDCQPMPPEDFYVRTFINV